MEIKHWLGRTIDHFSAKLIRINNLIIFELKLIMVKEITSSTIGSNLSLFNKSIHLVQNLNKFLFNLFDIKLGHLFGQDVTIVNFASNETIQVFINNIITGFKEINLFKVNIFIKLQSFSYLLLLIT